MMNINYPIKFEPILKDKIWGGEKLKALFNKKSTRNDIGESWEISDVNGNVSVVSNGDLKGQTLQEILSVYKGSLIGDNVYKNFGNNFPLLIKFIDAKEALSIQVHPNDDLAKERHNSFGKTEMWYVMQAEDEGDLIVGFNKNSSKEEYVEHLESKQLLKILNQEKVKKGDVYFIPTGRVHAIGAGVLLAEIQQTSDITYRIYDWDRLDDKGKSRELHTELALDAIDYSSQEKYTTEYKKETNKSTLVVDCNYFTTNLLTVNGEVNLNYSDKDSFIIYMCVAGEVVINYKDSKQERLVKGETILIPANLNEYRIVSLKKSELLEVYIKN
jgi:mannose-6-phosphate isomerase